MKTCHICGYEGPDNEFIGIGSTHRCKNASECFKRFYFKRTGIDFSTQPVEEQVEILKNVELLDILMQILIDNENSTTDEIPSLTKEKAEELLQSFVKED